MKNSYATLSRDEKCLHTLTMKQNSRVWSDMFLLQRRRRVAQSCLQVREGCLLVHFLKHSEHVCAEQYICHSEKRHQTICEKQPHKLHVILKHDNAHPHIVQSTGATVREYSWELLPHPSYSPDLAPSNYHLFRCLKDAL